MIDGTPHELHAGDAALVSPNMPHAARFTGQARVVVADFPLRHHLPGVAR